jgi:hypothetical protein
VALGFGCLPGKFIEWDHIILSLALLKGISYLDSLGSFRSILYVIFGY